MNIDKHYNPAIHMRLQSFVAQRDWQGVIVYLDTLSNAQFRTAGYILGERIVGELAEKDAWALILTLVEYNPKAFLVTLLKTISKKFSEKSYHLHCEGAKAFFDCVKGNALDTQKTLLNLLPVMDSPEDIQWLFRRLEVEEGEARVPYLVRTQTMAAAYALFRTLKYADHNHDLLVRVAYFLMKREDELAFNLASFLRSYYGLEEVKGTFALHIEPYQLARIENSYEAFSQAMKFN